MAEQGLNIANLIAALKLDLSQFEQGQRSLDQRLNALKTSLDQVSPPAEKAGGSIGTLSGLFSQLGMSGGVLGTALSLLTNPLSIVGLALGAAVEASRRAVDAFAATGEEVRRLQAVSGLSAEQAQDLGDTFTLLGSTSDRVTLAMYRMGMEIETGGAGLGRLGIAAQDSSGAFKTEGELFLEVRDRISALGSAAERNAALQDIFGRSARDLAPIFALTRDEFIKFMEQAGKFSPWSTEMQESATRVQRSSNEVKLAWEGLRNEIAESLAPAWIKLNETIAKSISHVREWIHWAKESKTAAQDLVDALSLVPGPKAPPRAAGEPPPIPEWSTETELGMLLGGGTQAAARTRPSNVAYQIRESELQRLLQVEQNNMREREALRAGDVASLRMSDADALRGKLADLDKEQAYYRQHYTALRALAIEKSGKESEATKLAMSQIQAQEAAAYSAIRQQRAQAYAQLAKIDNQYERERQDQISRSVHAAFQATEIPETQAIFQQDSAAAEKYALSLELMGQRSEFVTARISQIETILPRVAQLFGSSSDEVAGLQAELAGLYADLPELQRAEGIAADVKKAFAQTPEGVRDLWVTMDELGHAFDASEATAALFGDTMIATTGKIQAQEAAIRRLITDGYQPTDAAVQKLAGDLEQLKLEAVTQGFQQREEALRATAAVQQRAGVSGVDLTAQLESAYSGHIAALEQVRARLLAARQELTLQPGEYERLTESIGKTDAQIALFQSKLGNVAALNAFKDTVHSVFGAFERAISTSVTGVIQGTTTMKEAFNNMGRSILLAITEMVINRAFKEMEKAFNALIDSMIQTAQDAKIVQLILQALGISVNAVAAQKAGGGGLPPVGTQVGSGYNPSWAAGSGAGAKGAIVRKPTRALIGEAGPEALIPLDQMPGASALPEERSGVDLTRVFAMLADSISVSGTEVTIIDQRSGGEIERRESTGQDGRKKIELLIKDVVKGSYVGGEMDRIMAALYGLTRQGASR